jgi:hypothetical protein
MRRYTIQDGELVRAEPKDVLEWRCDSGPATGYERSETPVEGAALPQYSGRQFVRQPAIGVGQLGEGVLAGRVEIAAVADPIQHLQRCSTRGKAGCRG